MKERSIFSKSFRKLASKFWINILNYYLGTLVEISIQNFVILIEACLIDEVIYHKNMKTFLVIAAIYLIVYIGYSINFVLVLCVQQNTDNTFVMFIKKELFKAIIFSKPSILTNIKTGDNLNLITQDSNDMFLIIRKNVIRFSNEFILFISAWLIVFFMSWKVALLMLLITPGSVFASSYFGKRANKVAQEYKMKYSTFMSWIVEMLSGMNEIRTLGVRKNVIRLFGIQNKELLTTEGNQVINTKYSSVATDFIQLIGDLMLYVLSFLLVIRGEITIGSFVAFISYFEAGKLSIKNIIEYSIEYQGRKVSVQRVLKKLDEEPEDYSGNQLNKNGDSTIKFENVSFRYNKDKETLHNLNLMINPNESVAIVGESGTGKSTFINLILNLYQPYAGKIYIGDQDVNLLDLHDLRRFIGVVQQDIIIFPDTIRYNLTLGEDNITEETIWDACKRAKLYDVIKNLPDGLNSIIGKDGYDLSEGQKQRVAIARMYLRNPKIIILDEATSALDSEVEKDILSDWNRLSNLGKTIIVVSHRLSVAESCNKIVVLSKGKIADIGSHEELIKSSDEYIKLFKSQYSTGK